MKKEQCTACHDGAVWPYCHSPQKQRLVHAMNQIKDNQALSIKKPLVAASFGVARCMRVDCECKQMGILKPEEHYFSDK